MLEFLKQVVSGGRPTITLREPARSRRGRPTVMTDDMIAKASLLLPLHSISDIGAPSRRKQDNDLRSHE